MFKTDNKELGNRVNLIIELSGKVGRILLEAFLKHKDYSNKSDMSVVTKTDIMVENFIKNSILKDFPSDGIIAEETGVLNQKSDFLWTIDPIDGTLAFVSGMPSYSCLIGLIYKGESVFGMAIFPSFNEYVFAVKNCGVFAKTIDKHDYLRYKPINAITENLTWSFTDLKMFNNKKYTRIPEAMMQRYRYNRGFGDALGHILVAKGSINLMIDPDPWLKIWDIVPLVAILKESNRKFILLPNKDDNLFAASGIVSCLRQEDLEMIQDLL